MVEETLQDVVIRGLSITVYGKPLKPTVTFPADDEVFKLEGSGYSSAQIQKSGLVLAFVHAFSVKGLCTRLPDPILLVVPGSGHELEPADKVCAPEGTVKWVLRLPWKTMALAPSYESLEDLFLRPIDGGIDFSNPHFENGQLCVNMRVWVKVRILGRRWDWENTFPICLPVGSGCITVFEESVGPARVKVEACFRPPNQICAVFSVRVFGYNKSWDACVAIPMAAAHGVCA